VHPPDGGLAAGGSQRPAAPIPASPRHDQTPSGGKATGGKARPTEHQALEQRLDRLERLLPLAAPEA
jgi:hypothetical protein